MHQLMNIFKHLNMARMWLLIILNYLKIIMTYLPINKLVYELIVILNDGVEIFRAELKPAVEITGKI